MSIDITRLIAKGEGIDIEFKECKSEISSDVYETVCAFLNRIGGHILLGVEDNGNVTGIEPKAVAKIKSAFATTINNPNKIAPTFYTNIEEHLIDGMIVLHIPVNCSSQVHRLSGRFFDRNEDSDLDITDSVALVADMFNRKGNVYTEIRVFPHISHEDIETHSIERIRRMARAQKGEKPHLWESLSDLELLQSANLHGKDPTTDKEGMNLAGILLLGSEQLIASVLPHHKTDAIVRIKNLDRYDDRDTIYVNLVESFHRLMAFVEKHLDDPFYLEGNQRVSIRNKIFREVCSNLLIHREFSNAFPAKLIIESDKVRTENSNRPNGFGEIDANNFSPLPKNPIISKFFREIGLADELGSGVRNVNRYLEIYSGGKPQFVEGNIFKLALPMLARTSSHLGGHPSDHLGDYPSDHPGDYPSDYPGDYPGDKDISERILAFCIEARSKKELCEHFGFSDLSYFARTHLKPLIKNGKLNYTMPDKPSSKNQKYITISQ